MIRKEIKTKRLVLRALKNSDYNFWFDAYVNGFRKKSKWDLEPMSPKSCSKLQFKKLLKQHAKLAATDDYYRYYIFEKKSDVIVGHIDFDIFVRNVQQFANFGYQIYNRHWGKGYGSESAKAALISGFKQLRLNRIEAAINLDNKKSIRLAKSIGMRREGIKKRYWYEHGKWTDHLIYVANPEDLGLKSKKPFKLLN